jgi:uncharacterized protein HemX
MFMIGKNFRANSEQSQTQPVRPLLGYAGTTRRARVPTAHVRDFGCGASLSQPTEGNLMKVFSNSIALVIAAGLGMSVAACDSQQENAVEAQADATRDAAEATADALENRADAVGGATGEALENRADAVRATGEAKADAIEDQADRMDATPQ